MNASNYNRRTVIARTEEFSIPSPATRADVLDILRVMDRTVPALQDDDIRIDARPGEIVSATRGSKTSPRSDDRAVHPPHAA